MYINYIIMNIYINSRFPQIYVDWKVFLTYWQTLNILQLRNDKLYQINFFIIYQVHTEIHTYFMNDKKISEKSIKIIFAFH